MTDEIFIPLTLASSDCLYGVDLIFDMAKSEIDTTAYYKFDGQKLAQIG